MVASVSPAKLRAEVLLDPVTIFTDHRLVITCGGTCRGERILSMGDLLRMHGAQGTMGDLVRRLRCSHCRGQPSVVVLETGPEEATRGRMRRLSLRGPEFMQPDRNW